MFLLVYLVLTFKVTHTTVVILIKESLTLENGPHNRLVIQDNYKTENFKKRVSLIREHRQL